jgi:uncharacterized protein (TIGR02246 family)
VNTGRHVECTGAAVGLLAAFILIVPSASVAGANSGDISAIRGVLTSYQDALNSSSTAAAVSLYTEDGVLMPPYNQSVVGKAQLNDVYEAGFKLFTLHVKFTVREVIQISPDWAFARTSSAGTHKVNGTGAITPEANQELFVLKKSKGIWKIARYSFSSTNPPPH